jgi:hypothetical protein
MTTQNLHICLKCPYLYSKKVRINQNPKRPIIGDWLKKKKEILGTVIHFYYYSAAKRNELFFCAGA